MRRWEFTLDLSEGCADDTTLSFFTFYKFIYFSWRMKTSTGTTLMAETKEELKSLLKKVREESEKFG